MSSNLRPSVKVDGLMETKVDVLEMRAEVDYMADRALELLARIRSLREEKDTLVEALRQQRRWLLEQGFRPDHPQIKHLEDHILAVTRGGNGT